MEPLTNYREAIWVAAVRGFADRELRIGIPEGIPRTAAMTQNDRHPKVLLQSAAIMHQFIGPRSPIAECVSDRQKARDATSDGQPENFVGRF